MPSPTHETLVSLFRDCPALGLALLRDSTDVDYPRDTTARETAAAFSDLNLAEYRADVVVHLESEEGKPTGVIIIEIQLECDGDRRFSWPHYEASARRGFAVRQPFWSLLWIVPWPTGAPNPSCSAPAGAGRCR